MKIDDWRALAWAALAVLYSVSFVLMVVIIALEVR